jgi:transaldolase / glucose-6-phosphate isomerase
MDQLRNQLKMDGGRQSISMATTLPDAFFQNLSDWQKQDKVRRLWKGDPSLWTNSDETHWIGWLTVPVSEQNEMDRIDLLARKIKESYSDIVLLGMGGSSLCPDMMSKIFQSRPGYPRLHILDSTDPSQISHLEENINLAKTFFIVSSKSGTTLEPNILKDYFYARLQKLNSSNIGERFLAITDPGTKLEILAKQENFENIFLGIPSIGGRYSALSNFGMVPSGLMGCDVNKLLKYAQEMAKDCSPDVAANDNPGVLLGIILGVYAQQGKDKVTLIVSPQIASLGAWLEQLLAESTGKEGRGLIPVDQEELGTPNVYGDDRIFVYIRLEEAFDSEQDSRVSSLEQAGHVVVRLNLPTKQHIGAELFLWEMATAVAGSIIKINPFNQPNVEASKIRTNELMTEYGKTKHLPSPELLFSGEDIRLFTDKTNAQAIAKTVTDHADIKAYLNAHLSRVNKGDYVDISAFIERNNKNTKRLQEIRTLIRDWKKVATCFGFGPRFLHSTGQVYKGGPNTGIFLQITADHAHDLSVPGKPYTFGLVIAAQAQGDFEVLARQARRVLQIHLGSDVSFGLEKLHELIRDIINEKGK